MPADVAAAFVAAGQVYFKAAGKITLEQAFGVAVPSGGDPWYVKLARLRSDRALRLIGEMLCPVGTATDKADAVRSRVRRYQAKWQSREQYLDASPAVDEVERLLFTAFRDRDGSIPDSPSYLRRLLAA